MDLRRLLPCPLCEAHDFVYLLDRGAAVSARGRVRYSLLPSEGVLCLAAGFDLSGKLSSSLLSGLIAASDRAGQARGGGMASFARRSQWQRMTGVE